jgi:hypothetical protein
VVPYVLDHFLNFGHPHTPLPMYGTGTAKS